MNGVLLGFSVPLPVGMQLSGPETAAAEMHLTLIYMGKSDTFREDNRLQTLRHKLVALCTDFSPFWAEFSGTARFWGNEDTDPVVLLVNSVILAKLRIECLRILEECGIFPPENYGYIPHVTLRYVQKKSRVTIAEPPAEKLGWQVSALELWRGGEDKYTFPFGG